MITKMEDAGYLDYPLCSGRANKSATAARTFREESEISVGLCFVKPEIQEVGLARPMDDESIEAKAAAFI
ncbi:hypothetical protein TNCT_615701 [Trichonephila clavata]|uniref:Uncharacterized protein n=1 Tax=Trichonephila clavata TaxID=2740835 RepID=A0A8X6K3E2_TRICU|nr:hypothetical protein TNCT_615701 [Trichonephila clavata]